ncbi:MAG: SAM-dependent methyltransferase [Bacteroidetes bacterium]|nr:SAM-dependent methyltransferase [Bacteroidota bacterium]
MQHPVFTACVTQIRIWVAENARTLRRFLSALQAGISIPELEIFELERNYNRKDLENFLTEKTRLGPVGMVSEAGIPGMADPGSEVAAWGHAHNCRVIPVTGPSSVFLALSASGLNGQDFHFHGYPPIDEKEMKARLTRISAKSPTTHIYIETPYRSDRFLQMLLHALPAHTKLCIAAELHASDGFIRTQTVAAWKLSGTVIGKRPAVFLLGTP